MIWIGIDNGVTGSIAIVNDKAECLHWTETPTYKYPDYAASGGKGEMRRIQKEELALLFTPYIDENPMVIMEYPFGGGKVIESDGTYDYAKVYTQNKTILSAGWSFGDTLDVVEKMKLRHLVIPAKTWQKIILPGVTGRESLKRASRATANKLYPKVAIPKSADGDGICIAEYGRRMNL